MDNKLHEFIDWYRKAGEFSNTDQRIIERNVSVIMDAFNSCHAGFYIEKRIEKNKLVKK